MKPCQIWLGAVRIKDILWQDNGENRKFSVVNPDAFTNGSIAVNGVSFEDAKRYVEELIPEECRKHLEYKPL